MRDHRVYRALYETHSWAGICVGLVLFVICATGTLTVLRDEIRVWSHPRLRWMEHDPEHAIGVDRALAVLAEHHNLIGSPLSALRLPAPDNPAYELLLPKKGGGGGLVRAHVHPVTGEYLGEARSQLADLLFQLHSNLSLRSKAGRYVVGVAGVALVLLVVTGLLIHRRFFRDLFKLRWSHGGRVAVADTHKVLGGWLLPFHLVAAFTGSFLALKELLILLPAVAAYDGSFAAARKGLAERPPRPAGKAALMSSVDRMLTEARAKVPAFTPTLVVLHAWGDEKARVEIGGSLPPRLLLPKNEAARVRFQGASGALIEAENGADHGGWRRAFGALTPLHYGDFGGGWLRLVYFLFGASTTVLTFTGTMMWLGRRRLISEQAQPRERTRQGTT